MPGKFLNNNPNDLKTSSHTFEINSVGVCITPEPEAAKPNCSPVFLTIIIMFGQFFIRKAKKPIWMIFVMIFPQFHE